MLTFKNRASYI